MKKVFFLNGFVAIAIVGMVLSACTDNEPDYGSGTEVKVSMLLHLRSQRLEIQRMCCLLLKRWIKALFLQ